MTAYIPGVLFSFNDDLLERIKTGEGTQKMQTQLTIL